LVLVIQSKRPIETERLGRRRWVVGCAQHPLSGRDADLAVSDLHLLPLNRLQSLLKQL
jgi:hypothetical protein